MARVKGSKNKVPGFDAVIYVRCYQTLRDRLKKVLPKLSESEKVNVILDDYLTKRGA